MHIGLLIFGIYKVAVKELLHQLLLGGVLPCNDDLKSGSQIVHFITSHNLKFHSSFICCSEMNENQ